MAAASSLGRMRVSLCLLFVSFTVLVAAKLSLVGPKNMSAHTKEDVWLTCLIRADDFPLDPTRLIVHWSKSGFDKAIFNGMAQNATVRYGRPRAKLFRDEFAKGNASLFLSSVDMADNGLYLCEIEYAESKASHTINLHIQDAKVSISELSSREKNEGEGEGEGEDEEENEEVVVEQDEESWDRVKRHLEVGMVMGVLLIGLMVAVIIALAFKG